MGRRGLLSVRGWLVVALICLATVLTSFRALGDNHEPPDVVLRVGERAQAGKLSSVTMFYGPIEAPQGAPPGVYCGGLTTGPAPGPPYPSPRRVSSGYLAAEIELRRADAPYELSIRGWTKFDEERGPRGPRDIGYSLRPHEDGGQVVAWVADVTFRLRKHIYMDVDAKWSEEEDADGCPESLYATWRFHLKTRRA